MEEHGFQEVTKQWIKFFSLIFCFCFEDFDSIFDDAEISQSQEIHLEETNIFNSSSFVL